MICTSAVYYTHWMQTKGSWHLFLILLGASRGHHSVRLIFRGKEHNLWCSNSSLLSLSPVMFPLMQPALSPTVARDPSVLSLCVSVWGTLLISALGLVLVPMPIHSGAGELPGMRAQPIPANSLRERCSKNVFESKRTQIWAKLVSRTASAFLYLSTAAAWAQRPSLSAVTQQRCR